MIVDGRAIAHDIKRELAEMIAVRAEPLKLSVLVTTDDFATRQFVGIKRRFGTSVGVTVSVHEIPAATEAELCAAIQEAARAGGVLVQLPLPVYLDTGRVLNVIPADADVDVLGTEAFTRFASGKERDVLPPVVGAVREILVRHRVVRAGKRVVIIGEGRNVGAPCAQWFLHEGAEINVINRETENVAAQTRAADIIVLGAGSPGVLTPDMIEEGVIVLDAGTSEVGGTTRGDADPACAEKAALFTPVPGGVGPITVAMIFKNLLVLRGEK